MMNWGNQNQKGMRRKIPSLEKTPLSRFHFVLLVVACLVYFFAAANTVLIALALPELGKEFKFTSYELGWIVGLLYAGMFLGAFSCGRLSDLVGRKKVIALTTTIHSIFTGFSIAVWDFASLAILRVLAGFGLGGILPLPGVYISEYVPAKYRGRFLGLVETSWVFGTLFASALALLIMPGYGWRGYFLTAFVPLVSIPLTLFIPESVRYLEQKGRAEEAQKILLRYGIRYIPFKKEAEKTCYRELFAPSYRSRTLLLWILWAVLVYTYHGIFIWLKLFYVKTGLMAAHEATSYYFLATFLGQIPGYLSATFLLDVLGRKAVLGSYLALAGFGSLGFLLAQDPLSILFWSCVIGFGNLGAWAGLYAYTPELYPTRIRGTGAGVAASMGRVAGFLQGPLTGFILVVASLSFAFIKFALLHWIAALVLILLGIETKGRALEEISR
ncbi:MAG: MFS transporter [Candidatus Aenigmarchaeota archaeon]|nr:MFS transporter [Candidatus Aenigmarchaeota archaeon]